MFDKYEKNIIFRYEKYANIHEKYISSENFSNMQYWIYQYIIICNIRWQ